MVTRFFIWFATFRANHRRMRELVARRDELAALNTIPMWDYQRDALIAQL